MASKMTCKNSPKTFYTGKEMSPLGVGFCADAEKVGVKMTGKDKNVWVVGLKKGNKLWIRSKDEPKEDSDKDEEDSDKEEDDSDKDEDSDKDDEPEEEKPKPKKEKPEPKEEKPKPKKEPKSAIDKVLETHGIQGKAAEDIKALFAKKAKKAEDKPKRAPSTYNKYVKVRLPQLRAEMHEEKPDLKAKDYMALAGAEWKKMSDEEKAAFE